MNPRASENSSENADRVVGFLLVLSVSLIYMQFKHGRIDTHARVETSFYMLIYIQLTWPIIIFVCIFVILIERKVIIITR